MATVHWSCNMVSTTFRLGNHLKTILWKVTWEMRCVLHSFILSFSWSGIEYNRIIDLTGFLLPGACRIKGRALNDFVFPWLCTEIPHDLQAACKVARGW